MSNPATEGLCMYNWESLTTFNIFPCSILEIYII